MAKCKDKKKKKFNIKTKKNSILGIVGRAGK